MNPCPCGRADEGGPVDLRRCCGPYLEAAALPETCEQLMRSRYTAFVLGDVDHLWRTWHPRTRPTEIDTGGVRWTGLRVLGTELGGPGDETGVVEYEADHVTGAGAGTQRERSRFVRRGGRWMYLDGGD